MRDRELLRIVESDLHQDSVITTYWLGMFEKGNWIQTYENNSMEKKNKIFLINSSRATGKRKET